MPCWYYEKKDLINTPSLRCGINAETEARYRRDGARFIIDAGAKMGLRYDTCATGVVYFHRFYMFHSFTHFPRCITAACCLFLAGKVEETPKKCKDLIKIARTMLTDANFKEDPKEEIMTLERILLQTMKFDLMVEHPYSYLLKFAKLIKGDKDKVEKLVQMSWTFINDSLCTTLSLQWEPEIVAVALMYLASRLNKFDITDWQGKTPGLKNKWYESFVEDVTLELLEDICHQVLDLYSKPSSKGGESSTAKNVPRKSTVSNQSVLPKSFTSSNHQQDQNHVINTSGQLNQSNQPNQQPSQPISIVQSSQQQTALPVQQSMYLPPPPPSIHQWSQPSLNQNNPYMTSCMYSSSFLDTEGSQSIQSLVDKQSNPVPPIQSHLSTSFNYQPTILNQPPPPPHTYSSSHIVQAPLHPSVVPDYTDQYPSYVTTDLLNKSSPLLPHPPPPPHYHRHPNWR